jgi:hypothetical protein
MISPHWGGRLFCGASRPASLTVGPKAATPTRSSLSAATAVTILTPWYIAHTDGKKRGRLNIISHLLSQIPCKPLAHPGFAARWGHDCRGWPAGRHWISAEGAGSAGSGSVHLQFRGLEHERHDQ